MLSSVQGLKAQIPLISALNAAARSLMAAGALDEAFRLFVFARQQISIFHASLARDNTVTGRDLEVLDGAESVYAEAIIGGAEIMIRRGEDARVLIMDTLSISPKMPAMIAAKIR